MVNLVISKSPRLCLLIISLPKQVMPGILFILVLASSASFIVFERSFSPSVAICILAKSKDAISIYDGLVVWTNLSMFVRMLMFTLSPLAWSIDACVIPPIILCVLWTHMSTPASNAAIGSSLWNFR